jgi:ABC-type polysaccharide/polyol phosphate transport system ATPase subunit
MSVAIEARNISKRFFLGERNQRAFFEDFSAKAMRGVARLLRPREASKEKASYRDVSFQVSQGQTLAIIPANLSVEAEGSGGGTENWSGGVMEDWSDGVME